MTPTATTTAATADCDVLVVGAGPTGLTLAAQLLARGIATRVVDRDPGTPHLSRAIGITPRTLEALDAMGIADRFLDVGHRVRRIGVHRGTRHLFDVDMAHCGSAHRFQLHLPQQRTEALLRARVAELGGAVEQGVELLRLTDDGDGVVATVRDGTGAEHEITAGHLVGCDGAHSRVRHLLGVPFPGRAYPWDWLLADAHLDWSGRADSVHLFASRDGLPLACVPITPDLWRLSLPTPGDRGGVPPTLAEVQALVDDRGPGGMTVSDPETLTTFRCQLRSAATYRRGRVLLAGDAVHVHSPAGGQGMNTGMLDATNLAWRLALVVRGRSPGSLLDGYEEERRPAAAEVLRFSESLVRFATAPRSPGRSLRAATLPLFRLPPAQRRLASRIAQTAVGYPGGTPARCGRVTGPPAAGRRMPDVPVRGAGTLYAALRGGRHVLLLPEGTPAGAGPAAPADLVDVVAVPPGTLPGPVLVRPDGHVAAAGNPAALRGRLRQLTAGADRSPGLSGTAGSRHAAAHER